MLTPLLVKWLGALSQKRRELSIAGGERGEKGYWNAGLNHRYHGLSTDCTDMGMGNEDLLTSFFNGDLID